MNASNPSAPGTDMNPNTYGDAGTGYDAYTSSFMLMVIAFIIFSLVVRGREEPVTKGAGSLHDGVDVPPQDDDEPDAAL